MAKPTIVTRAGKGSALTWTEGDSNLTNLQDATITIKADTGGTDVVSDLNGSVTLVAGTNVSITGDNTAKTVTINSTASGGASALDDLTDVVITAAATNDVLVYNGTNWVDTAASSLTVGGATLATSATNVDIGSTDGNAADTLMYLTMVPLLSATDQQVHIDSGLSYNASTNTLTASGFSGVATTATNATNINISTTTGNANDTALYPVMVAAAATGNQSPHIDITGMAFNATANTLTLGNSGANSVGAIALNTASAAFAATIQAPTLAASYTLTLPTTAGSASQVLTTNGSGTLSWSTALVSGGALGTPSSGTVTNLTGTASININGTVGATTATTGRFTTVQSTVATGTAPFTVASTTNVANLNASSLNGATFAAPGAIGGTTPSTGTFTTATLDAGGELRLNNTADTFYVGFKAGTLAANKIWTLPTADGTANQVLKTDGAGNLGWSTAGGGSFDPASPGEIGATTPAVATFTGATLRGGTGVNRARLLLDNTTHQSTAWGATGIGIVASNATYRDTSSTGTVSAVYIHTLSGANLERSTSGAFTNAATLYVSPPSAGFQTTITNPALAAFFDGAVRVAQNLNVDGGFSMNGAVGATSPNTGAFTTISASGAITSTVATGTAPFTVASTTVVANLNASLLGGASFGAPGAIGSITASTGAFTTLTASSTVTLSPANTSVTISPTGTGTIAISPATAGTINNTSIGVTTAAAGRFTTLTATGAITLVDVRETVFAIGNSGATTLTPNAANGSVQTITATGNFTLSAFTSPVSGQTITFIITQDATGSRTLTSTMKFAGGSKTLTTTAGAIDILTVSYIGTTYYASLSKGFV